MKEKKKFFEKKWFMWLTLFVFPPLGIGVIWTINKNMKKLLKIILTVVFVFWFAILVVAAATGSDDEGSDTTTSTHDETEEVISYTNDADSINNLFNDVFKNDIKDIDSLSVSYDNVTESYLVSYYPTSDVWDETQFVRNNLTDYIDFCKEAYTIDGVTSITFQITTTLQDSKGNESIEDVMDVRMSKDMFNSFNWDNMEFKSDSYNSIVNSCDFYWLYPGILANIDSSKIYYAP